MPKYFKTIALARDFSNIVVLGHFLGRFLGRFLGPMFGKGNPEDGATMLGTSK